MIECIGLNPGVRQVWRLIGLLLLLVPVVGATGCNRSREFAEVEGQVTLDGEPLTDVEVVFLPDPIKGNQANNASAFTDTQGRYRLFATRDNREGTVLGPHRVIITDLSMVVDTSSAGEPRPAGDASSGPRLPGTRARRFPVSYGDALRTPFGEIEVQRGKQTIDLAVKSSEGGSRE